MGKRAKKVKKALSLIMALIITFTSLNLTDVAKINAQAEEIGEDISYSVSDGEIKESEEITGEEAKKDALSLATGLYMADLFNFNNDRHPYAFGDYRSEGAWYEEFEKTYSPQIAKTISHYAFRFYDAATNTFTALTRADLTVLKSNPAANDFEDDNFTLPYSLDGVDNNNYEIYELYHNEECTYTISYTYQGTTYSVNVVVELPGAAFYSSSTRDTNSLIDQTFYYSNKNNKIYLLTDGNKPASAYSFNYEIDWKSIPAGDETKYVSVSADNSEITLKPGCEGLKIGIVEKSSGSEMWSVYIEEAPTSGLRFMNEIDRDYFFDELEVYVIWEDNELDEKEYTRNLPNSMNFYIFGYYDIDNDTYTPVSLDDSNISFNGCEDLFIDTNCTVEYKDKTYKVYKFETEHLGDYVVTYNDGVESTSVTIKIILPEIGFYSSTTRDEESLILHDLIFDKYSYDSVEVNVLYDSNVDLDDYHYEIVWWDENGEHIVRESDFNFFNFVDVNESRNKITIKRASLGKQLRIRDINDFYYHGINIRGKDYSGLPFIGLYNEAIVNAENLCDYEVYYVAGKYFYVIETTEEDLLYGFEVTKNGVSYDWTKIFDYLVDSNGISILTVKDDIDFEFELEVQGYKLGSDEEGSAVETLIGSQKYQFLPSVGILGTTNFREEWSEESEEWLVKFNNGEEDGWYSRFEGPRSTEVKNKTHFAFAYVERYDNGSIYYVDPINIEDCSLTLNGKPVDKYKYFVSAGYDKYTAGGRFEDCSEEFNNFYNIYSFCSDELGTFILSVNVGGYEYHYEFECVLPTLDFYSKSERSVDTLIDTLDYSSTNKTVYLLTGEKQYEDQEDLVIESIEIRNDFENRELSEDEIKEYVTVTKVTNGYKFVFTDKIADYYYIDFRTNYGRRGVEIKDCRPGLRICDNFCYFFNEDTDESEIEFSEYSEFVKRNPDEYLNYDSEYTFALAYVNNNTYKPLKLSDIKVTLDGKDVKNSIITVRENVPYTFDSNNNNTYNIYSLPVNGVGEYVISYDPTPSNTRNNDVVKMVIDAKLPDIALYSRNERSIENYIGGFAKVNKNKNVLYLISEKPLVNKKFTASVYDYYSCEETDVKWTDFVTTRQYDNYSVEIIFKNPDMLKDCDFNFSMEHHSLYCNCEDPVNCENFDNHNFTVARMDDPAIQICDSFNVDWSTGRFIGFDEYSSFYPPEEATARLCINQDYYVALAYVEDTGKEYVFAPVSVDKLKVYRDENEIEASSVFNVVAKALPYNRYEQEGLGNKYDVYKFNTEKTGLYTVKYDPNPSNDTEEDIVSLNFRVDYENCAFYSSDEISDETYLGSDISKIYAINGENNIVYFKAFDSELNYKLYTVVYDEYSEYIDACLYDSENPGDNEYSELGITITELPDGLLKIKYDGCHDIINICVVDESCIDEWNVNGIIASLSFVNLHIIDGNIKSTYSVGEEVKKDKLYIDYYDGYGYKTITAYDAEKLGYTLKLEYADVVVEPNEEGKLIFSVPGDYRWNLYKDDELFAEGQTFGRVYKKIYTPALGQEIEIEGVANEERTGLDNVVKLLAEAGMTYRITAYPSDSTITDYNKGVLVEGLYYDDETGMVEFGPIGGGDSKYIFFQSDIDGDVFIQSYAECNVKIKIEKYSHIENVWIDAPEDYKYWYYDDKFIGVLPEDMSKVMVDTSDGIYEYDVKDVLNNIYTEANVDGFGGGIVTYSGSVGSFSVEKRYNLVHFSYLPEKSLGSLITTDGFYKVNLTKDKYYEFNANSYKEEGLRILLLYIDEDGKVNYIFDKEGYCISIKAEETGTYYLLVEGLESSDNTFIVREGKKTVVPNSNGSGYEKPYGFNNPLIELVGRAWSYVDGVQDTPIYLSSESKAEKSAALFGFKYELVKEDKVTVAKKDKNGFYPVGNYYYRFTIDANYDTEPTYSDLIKIIAADSKYSIVYHTNGKTIKQTDIKPNVVFNLKANTEKKVGYTFLGWAVSRNGEITEDIIVRDGKSPVVFTDKEKVTNIYIPGMPTTDLWAVWELNEYTIEYNNLYGTDACKWDDDGRIVPRVQTYTVEDKTVELLNPSITVSKYTGFGGWFSDENYVNEVTKINPSDAKNYVLYAKKLVPAYTITFVANGGTGTEMSKLTVYDGMEIKIPACSYKNTGYTFYAWASHPDYGMLFFGNETVKVHVYTEGSDTGLSFVNAEEDSITGALLDENNNVTLYAYWSKDFHILYHNVLGTEYTSADVAEGQSLEYNKVFKTLLKPTRTGYTFSGWYDEAGKKVTAITAKGEKLTYHLYPKWTAKSYNVKFDKNGAVSGSMSAQKHTFDKPAVLSANKFSRPGYVFLGWSKTKVDAFNIDATDEEITEVLYCNNQEEVINVSAEGKDITLYAVWKETNYTIIFNPGCDCEEIEGDLSDITYNYSKTTGVTLPVISMEGYEFKGWYTSADPKCKKLITTTKGLSSDMTLYAHWAVKYNIVFYANGGTGTTKAITNVKLGDAKKLTKNGFTYKDELGNKYAFMGWSTDPYAWDAEYSNQAKITIVAPYELTEENGKYVLNLYAVWKRVFNVNYDLDDGTVGDVEYIYTYGTGIKSLPTPVRDGYTFAGWYKDPNFKSKVTSIPANSVGDVELYAKWTGNKYTVSFDANAPFGSKASGKMKNESLIYGTSKALTKNAFKVTGYKFLGWSKYQMLPLMADDDFEPEFVNSEKVTSIASQYKSNVTLYAVWQYVPTYVTVYVNGVADYTYEINDIERIGTTVTLDEINKAFRYDNGEFYFYDKLYTDKSCKKLFKGSKITSGEIKLYTKKRVQINY